MAAADPEPPPDEADLLRLVHGRRRLRPAVPAVVAADAVLRRVLRGAARRPRLEQDRAVGRGGPAPDGSRDPRPGARLDHRPLRPAGADPHRRGGVRRRLHAVQPGRDPARVLRRLHRDGDRLELLRLLPGQRRADPLVRALARPRAVQPFARPRARRHFRPGDRLVARRLRLARHRVRLGRRLYPGRPAARLDHPPPARGPRRDDRWLAFKNRNCECFRGERRTDP